MRTHPLAHTHLPSPTHTPPLSHTPHLTQTLPYVCAQQICLGSRLRVGSAKFAISINEQTHTHAHTAVGTPNTHTHAHPHTLPHWHTGRLACAAYMVLVFTPRQRLKFNCACYDSKFLDATQSDPTLTPTPSPFPSLTLSPTRGAGNESIS